MQRAINRIRRVIYLLGALTLVIGALLLFLTALSAAAEDKTETRSKAIVSSNINRDRWRIFADMERRRGDPGVVSYNDKIYVIGGFFSGGGGYPDSLEIYHPLTDSWEIRFNLPVTRSDFVAATVRDKIYAIGGWRGESLGVSGLNHEYDVDTDTWITKTSMITPVSGAGGVVMSDTIYNIGGFDGVSRTRDVQIYDPVANNWSLGTPMQVVRGSLGAAVLDGKIFAIGGVTSENVVTSSVEVYDPASDSWTNGPALPGGRAKMAVGVRDGKIYVIGGTDNWATKSVTNTTFVYDPGSGKWSTIMAMPTARRATDAATVGDILYVVGGAGEFGAGKANEAFPFEAFASTTEITADNPDPSIQNHSFAINFAVASTGGIPSGLVTVTVDGDSATCSDELVNGLGSCEIALSLAGKYILTASYGGDEFTSLSSDNEDHAVNFGLYTPYIVK